MIFDVKPDDVYWCAADIGWVTGHSYIVYGPLANATTSVMYEGSPDTPAWDRWWQIVEDYKVTILYTAPTAIRAFMKQGEQFPEKHDLSSLRLLGSVGEPINPEAWLWYHQHIGGEKRPIVDTWWQTETGQILITPLPGVTTTKPGSATFPFPGIEADVVDARRQSGAARRRGIPRPQAALAGDAPGHLRRSGAVSADVLEPVPGHVLRGRRGEARRRGLLLAAGPGRRRDERRRPPDLDDRGGIGAGRSQEGRRGGGRRQEDPVSGQAIFAFVIVKTGVDANEELGQELREHVNKVIGPIARPKFLLFTPDLPKTRSGKIMRRLLRDIAEGRTLGDTTTLADSGVVETIREQSGTAEE